MVMEKAQIKGTRIKEGGMSRAFDVFNAAIMILLCISILLPFWFLLVQSLDSVTRTDGLYLWPQRFTIKYYSKVLGSKAIWYGYANTIYRVVGQTSLQLFCGSMGAYAISKKYFPHRVFWTFFMLITMFISGGLIPTYLWYSTLGFVDNRLLVYIVSGMVNVYNLVMIRNYINTIPGEMEESARLDGAGDFKTFLYIILPMSKPIIATVALWVIVGNWNAWFDCLVYIRSGSKQVLQVVLRRVINEGSNEILEAASVSDMAVSPDMLKAATIYVSTLPVLLLYPFVQKYFVKGIYVGSLKG